jgi:hypothetical protein
MAVIFARIGAFFVSIFGKILVIVLPLVLDWIKTQAVLLITKIKAKMADRAKNKEAREKLEKAETPEQIDAGAKDIADNF